MAEPEGAAEDLDALVRRVDPDRWLASRFIADPARRGAVVALYALNHELARVAESVTQPLAGEIRLAWWRDRIEGLRAGDAASAAHPVLQAMAAPRPDAGGGGVVAGLSGDLLDALVEARHADLEPAPFADEAALVRYLDGTAGAVMALAATALDPAVDPARTRQAARAWGWAGLIRALPVWAGRNRRWAPLDWGALDDAMLIRRARERTDAALTAAHQDLQALPVAAFPAVAYAALARPYARGRTLTALGARARLVLAAATGRI